jgi:hypothetical protein
MFTVETIREETTKEGELIEQGFTEAFSAQMVSNDRAEVKRLRSKHDSLKENESHWRFLLRAYEGGPSYVGAETLFKHHRETLEDFQDRLLRAHYTNYIQPLVDFVPQYIYNQPIEREAEESLRSYYDRWKVNVDQAGTDISAFMHEFSEYLRIFGKMYVLVDKPEAPVGVDIKGLSELDAEALGIDLPYLVMLHPLEVFDWTTNHRGEIEYLKRFRQVGAAEEYTEWYVDKIVVSLVEKNKVNQKAKANSWNMVPIIPIFEKRSKSDRNVGIPFAQDLAYQNRHVFNLTSLIDEFLYRQAFNVLAMESETAIPQREQIEGTLGTSNVLEVPKGASKFPEYISPPVDPAEFIQNERDNTIQQMFRQASQDISSEIFSVSNRSGDAAKQAFGRTVPVIAKLADILQDGETRIMHIWAKMLRKKWSGKIAYKDDYSLTNLMDMLLELAQIFNTLHVLSPTFVREEWKRVIREFDSRISQDSKEKIFREIDAISDDEIKEMFNSPEMMKAKLGVPSTANMIQGKEQVKLGSDKKIGLAKGNQAGTKESSPDADRRSKGSRASTSRR